MSSHLRAAPPADSGNETLASDESPPPRAAPPRIQPCSGVLPHGKVVIRPIAFKPGGATRLCNAGERYGSTPVLASRPGSHATTYGSSSDLRGPAPRPLERQPASLSSLPARPPHPQTMTTASYGCGGGGGGGAEGGGSLAQLAPSPADSGVAELEAARLASDLADPATFSVAPHSRCERGAVRAERRRAGEAGARAAQLAAAARRDADALRARLEDAEWTLCRRSGELALVKTQLKERQNELTAKGHDYLQLKGEYRQVRDNFERKEKELLKMQSENEEKDKTVKQLHIEINRLNMKFAASESELARNKEHSGQEIDRLKSELKELREELSDVSLSGYEGIESGRSMRGIYDMCKNGNEYHWNSNDSSLEDAEVQRLNGELPDLPCAERCQANALIHRLKCEIETKENEFDKERRKWSEEKEKVLRYQKQLQLNYVQMFRRSRNLEAEVESLRLELELCNKNMKNLGKLGKTIEL